MAEHVQPPIESAGSGRWAPFAKKFRLPSDRRRIDSLTIEGKRPTGANAGFGQLWEKSFELDAGQERTPEELLAHWRDNFGEYWPDSNHFAPFRNIAPGEIAAVDVSAGPATVSTGVMVLHSSPRSFTFITPEGHPFAGWITASCRATGAGTVARIRVLVRASDPLYEIGLMLGGNAREDAFWLGVLENLADDLGVPGKPRKQSFRRDSSRRWANAGNIVNNAAIRSVFYNGVVFIGRPFRAIIRLARRGTAGA